MGSTLALWAYHRRLSLDAQRIKNQDVARRESLTTPTVPNYSRKPATARTVSECSTSHPSPRDRKVSWKTEDSSSEEDEEEEPIQSKPPAESTQKRRFSLDFIFSRNKKKEKPKVGRKRSQSVAVGHEDDHSDIKDNKYPGIHNSDFAALYFY